MWLKRFTVLSFMGLVALALVIAPSDRAEAQVTFGTNWQAQFFNDPNAIFGTALPTPVFVTNYPAGMNFVWPAQPLDPLNNVITSVNADNFSVLFASNQNITTPGIYQFYGQVDDRIIVAIDGLIVYEQNTPGNFSFTVEMQAGIRNMAVGMVELTNQAVLQFQWQFIGNQAIGTAVPLGPQGRVVSVRGLSLRTGPYLGASRIGVLRPDNSYTVLGKSDDEGSGYTWYNVVAGDQVGWTSGRYFVVDTADPNLVPTVQNVFQTLDNPESTGVIGVTRAVMNFRIRPSQRSPRLGQIPWGAEVEIFNRTLQAGMNHWFQVRYNNQIGWIYAPFVATRNGFINTVPVR